jgi:pimeloyl-ACP methyl ester carboxylesterase
METKKIKIGQLTFDCLIAGNKEHDLVIFLHGFPETAMMWSPLMEKVSSLGFYCLAPNMRGYSKDACPKGVKNYTVADISQDILDIAYAIGKDRFHLVGHDWGAIIGWNLTYNNPSTVISWSALSVPHTSAFLEAYKFNKEQQHKSRYIKWFILPIFPELWLRRKDFALFRRLWKHSSTEEVEYYLSVFRNKDSLTGALNYYRANIGRGKVERIGKISTPTLFIWGNRDLAISASAAENCVNFITGEYTFLPLDGGHWLIQSNYLPVSEAIETHLLKHK